MNILKAIYYISSDSLPRGRIRSRQNFLASTRENFETYSILSLSLLSLISPFIKPLTGNLSKLIKYAVNIPEIKTANGSQMKARCPTDMSFTIM